MLETAWRVAGLAAWMASWWLTAVVPLEATALLPVVVLPLVGERPVGEVTRSYADPIIFLFLGGFFLAATTERWDLHKRFALATVRAVGTDAPRVVAAFQEPYTASIDVLREVDARAAQDPALARVWPLTSRMNESRGRVVQARADLLALVRTR